MSEHLSLEEIERLAHLQGDMGEVSEWLFHLLGCGECQDQLQASFPDLGSQLLSRYSCREAPQPSKTSDSPPREAVTGSLVAVRPELERAIRESLEARELAAELMDHPPEQRKMWVANSRRFRTLGLPALLLERTLDSCQVNPQEAQEAAELALEILKRLPRSLYRARLINDFTARAWAYIGNCRRILSDFGGAERAFARAWRVLRQGSGDQIDAARVLDLESLLRRDQRCAGGARRGLRLAATPHLGYRIEGEVAVHEKTSSPRRGAAPTPAGIGKLGQLSRLTITGEATGFSIF